MTTNNLKTIVMFSVLAVVVGSVVALEQVHANAQTGQTFIKELRTSEPSADHIEMKRLQEIVISEVSTDADKNNALDEMQVIMDRTANRTPALLPEKQAEIRGDMDLLADGITELKIQGVDIPVVGIGTDYENGSVRIEILDTAFDTERLQGYEDTIRQILGNDVDITLEPRGQMVADVCYQTGDCNPIKGGVKIQVENAGNCSIGFKASYDQRTGFVTAGHCNSSDIGGTGESVGNPTNRGRFG